MQHCKALHHQWHHAQFEQKAPDSADHVQYISLLLLGSRSSFWSTAGADAAGCSIQSSQCRRWRAARA